MLAWLFALALAQAPAAPRASAAEAVITQAVISRLGGRATVVVHVGDSTLPDGPFVSATPDPMGRLGGDINFTLIPAGPGARAIRVRAKVEVIANQVRTRNAILRGHPVTAEDVEEVEAPLVGVAVRRLPEISQIIGQQALRPIASGQVVESGFVAVRHVVQAGETVTVVAVLGSVQVTALFVAADSGDPGDIIRVVNKDTHRSIRVRVVNKGVVEVINAR